MERREVDFVYIVIVDTDKKKILEHKGIYKPVLISLSTNYVEIHLLYP
jgi:hypothetical protein